MTADVTLGLALGRGRRDFTDLDRLLLKVIGSRLQQAT